MNAVSNMARDLASAKADAALAQANLWPDAIRPLIQTYLELGAMLDNLGGHFNGWRTEPGGERLMSEAHAALVQSHDHMRRNLAEWRAEAIDDANPRPYARRMTDAEEDEYLALVEHLSASVISVDAAVKAMVA